MAYVILYLSCMALGYFCGSRVRSKNLSAVGISGAANVVMLVSVSLMVFLMGVRMGSNEEVISNLGTIGLLSLFFTVWVTAGGVLAVTFARKLLGMDKYGLLCVRRKKGSEALNSEDTQSHQQSISAESEEKEICGGGKEGNQCGVNTGAAQEASDSEDSGTAGLMMRLIIIFVAAGLAFGYFYVRTQIAEPEAFHEKAGYVMTVGLCILMGSIGLDMGLAGKVAEQIKQIGFRVMVFPFAVILGTAAASFAAGLFLPLTVRESLAVGFGFGWYTFAPVTITGAGHAMAGAVSFMHNVIRETCGIILIPVLAKKIGYIEVCSLPGVAAADIGMSLVEKSTRADIIIYSFAIGIVESLLIPLLVSLAIGA